MQYQLIGAVSGLFELDFLLLKNTFLNKKKIGEIFYKLYEKYGTK